MPACDHAAARQLTRGFQEHTIRLRVQAVELLPEVPCDTGPRAVTMALLGLAYLPHVNVRFSS